MTHNGRIKLRNPAVKAEDMVEGEETWDEETWIHNVSRRSYTNREWKRSRENPEAELWKKKGPFASRSRGRTTNSVQFDTPPTTSRNILNIWTLASKFGYQLVQEGTCMVFGIPHTIKLVRFDASANLQNWRGNPKAIIVPLTARTARHFQFPSENNGDEKPFGGVQEAS